MAKGRLVPHPLMLVVILVAAGPVAIAWPQAVSADGQPGPTLDRTTAVVVAAVEHSEVDVCDGPGGEHYRVDLTVRGPATSNDARLDGEFLGHVRVLLQRTPADDDLAIGHGRDDFVIQDTTGVKVRGTAYFVFDSGKPLKGLAFAKLRDGGTWITNFSVAHQLVAGPLVVDDTLARAGGPPVAVRGPLVARLGGQESFSPSDPGLIQTGSCLGGLGADPLADPPIYP